MTSIMEVLFNGRYIPWERRGHMTEERREIEEKIQREKRYFIEKMSLDDCQRFEKLENLYGNATHMEEVDIYSHGFALGVLLTLEVMETRERMTDTK